MREYCLPDTFQDFCLSQGNNKDGLAFFSPPGVQSFFVHCKQNFQTQIFAKEKKSQTWNTYLKFDRPIHSKTANKDAVSRMLAEVHLILDRQGQGGEEGRQTNTE